MFLNALVLKFDASITFRSCNAKRTDYRTGLMTAAICSQGAPRLARRLEESSLADAETTSPKEMLPDARALKPATDKTSFDKESTMKPPPHALPKFPANFKTTTPIN